MDRHWEQGRANQADKKQVSGSRAARNTGGKHNTGNTSEQEEESDNETQEDTTTK